MRLNKSKRRNDRDEASWIMNIMNNHARTPLPTTCIHVQAYTQYISITMRSSIIKHGPQRAKTPVRRPHTLRAHARQRDTYNTPHHAYFKSNMIYYNMNTSPTSHVEFGGGSSGDPLDWEIANFPFLKNSFKTRKIANFPFLKKRSNTRVFWHENISSLYWSNAPFLRS